MNIDQAKAIPIAEILSRLDIYPRKTNQHKLLYLSPVRVEKTPSFWVDTKTNRYHDYGDGNGGDSIDLACAYLRFTEEAHTVSDALRWLNAMGVGPYQIAPIDRPVTVEIQDTGLSLKAKRPIQHVGLIRYLEQRGISLEIARRHLKELRVHNSQTNKYFLALGFANEEGGYELRNPFFKGCLKPKAITFIRGRDPKPDSIHLFEGFMDYLSAVCQLKGHAFRGDAIILNSLSCLNQAIPYIHNYGYRVAYSWLDNDMAGEKATAAFREFCKTQTDLTHKRMNRVYAPHKDVNAWHMHTLNL